MALIQWFLAFALREKKGATAVEYGLMVALIAIVIIGAVFAIGFSLNNVFSTVANCLNNLDAGNCP